MSDKTDSFIISADDPILITGASGFIGSRVVQNLLDRGFRNLICFGRPSSKLSRIQDFLKNRPPGAQIRIQTGNLLSRRDCEAACRDVAVIIHLAAGTGEKSFPDAFMNSVVTTRNLLEASLDVGKLKRFALISSFSVYSNCGKPQGRLLDESCPVEEHGELRGEAYCFAKVKQEEIVAEYSKRFGIPYVLIRPGNVYGDGKKEIIGRVGINTFGIFLHIGGSNTLPLTYVDNCAEAISLAALVRGVDGEIFNVVDDDLPTSRQFLRWYKSKVKRFPSIYLPGAVSLGLCTLWEKYSQWSKGQLPPVFNRRRWHAYWKRTKYSNEKLKSRLGWTPTVSTDQALERYFKSCVQNGEHA
jgi:nucleoside-diphosphate-sugar epimerase